MARAETQNKRPESRGTTCFGKGISSVNGYSRWLIDWNVEKGSQLYKSNFTDFHCPASITHIDVCKHWHVVEWTHVCTFMWRPGINNKDLSLLFLHLLFEMPPLTIPRAYCLTRLSVTKSRCYKGGEDPNSVSVIFQKEFAWVMPWILRPVLKTINKAAYTSEYQISCYPKFLGLWNQQYDSR